MISRSHENKVLYLLLMASANFLGFLKLIVYSKLISVHDFGIYSLVLSVYIFFVFFGGMGLQEGLLKQGSMSFAADDIKSIKAYFIRALIFSTTIAGSVVLSITLITRILFRINNEILLIFELGMVLGFATILFNLIDAFVRCQQKFLLFSVLLTIKNITAISVGIILAEEWGAKGLIFSEIISLLSVFFVTLFFLVQPRDINLYRGKRIIDLISNGYQMMLTSALRNFSLMLDRWFIALVGGATAVGYYSISMILLTVCMNLVGFMVTIKGPEWISNFESNKNVHTLIRNVNTIIRRALLVVLFVGPFLLLNIERALLIFNPAYANDVVFNIIIIVYLSLFTIVPIYLYDWVFVATSQEGLLIKINIWSTGISIFLYTLVWILEGGVEAFAAMFFMGKIITLVGYVWRIRTMYVI